MKILSADQIRQADRYTIFHEPISSIDLMERVATACTEYILEHTEPGTPFIVVCGKGNNGGDGLAIARMLVGASCRVEVYILEYTEGNSLDFLQNLGLLSSIPSVGIYHISGAADFMVSDPGTVIIDAILGTGINKPTDGLIADVIDEMNNSGQAIISIDVPSGLPIDDMMAKKWPIVKAKTTLTFQQPKFSFLFAEGGEYVGEFRVLDIGLNRDYIASLESSYHYTEEKDITSILLKRGRYANKGTFGHSLLICGSYGKIGAAVLSSHAALRSGTGLLTIHVPQCGYSILQTSLPEAMVSADTHPDHISILPPLAAYSSIGIGPGIGKHEGTATIVKQLIQASPYPIVLDADALNILSENKTWLAFLPPRSILTPHPKEFDRLTQPHSNSMDRLASARALAHRHSIIIVLKGAYTSIVMPDRTVWFNPTGNAGLAKGGSGDILTGIITALISRGYEPADAAFLGVYLHGLAADIAISNIHPEALLASDVVDYLSDAFEYLYEAKT
jgi:NAD(P)H-hydrate epimerase